MDFFVDVDHGNNPNYFSNIGEHKKLIRHKELEKERAQNNCSYTNLDNN